MGDLIDRQDAINIAQELIIPSDGYRQYNQAVNNYAARLMMLPSAQPGWIPCSERLPNCNGVYLVWRPHFWGGEIGMPAICYFDGQNTWHDSYGVDFERVLHPDDVTAWMPLPEPYKEEQDE